MQRLGELTAYEYPILLASAVRVFIGSMLGGFTSEDRDEGTVATCITGYSKVLIWCVFACENAQTRLGCSRWPITRWIMDKIVLKYGIPTDTMEIWHLSKCKDSGFVDVEINWSYKGWSKWPVRDSINYVEVYETVESVMTGENIIY